MKSKIIYYLNKAIKENLLTLLNFIFLLAITDFKMALFYNF